jgi:hypothetical protein
MQGVRNALLVGGQKRCWDPIKKYLGSCRVQILDHWYEDKHIHRSMPAKTDIVILIATQASHEFQDRAKSQAGKLGIPIVFTSHKFTELPANLAKFGIEPAPEPAPEPQVHFTEEPTEPLVPIEDMVEVKPAPVVPLQPPSAPATPPPAPEPVVVQAVSPAVEVPQTPERPNEDQKPTESDSVEVEAEKERPMRKRRKQPHPGEVRAEEKKQFVRELLRKDPSAPFEEINADVMAKFPGSSKDRPGGMARAIIAKLRVEETGLQYGPGGRLMRIRDENGKKLAKPVRVPELERKEPEAPKEKVVKVKSEAAPPPEAPRYRVESRPEAAADQSTDRLKQLVTELRHLMSDSHLDSIVIPLAGEVEVHRSVVDRLSI